jgi:hypothetical protein
MSLNTLPIDIDKEKLHDLLERLSKRVLQRDESEELKPLLERIWSDAIKQGDMGLASELAQMLIALDGYVHRKVNLCLSITNTQYFVCLQRQDETSHLYKATDYNRFPFWLICHLC